MTSQSLARIIGIVLLAGTPLLCPGHGLAQAASALKATPKTVAWGYYDAKAAPVLRVKLGDMVEIQRLLTDNPKGLEKAGLPPGQVEQFWTLTWHSTSVRIQL